MPLPNGNPTAAELDRFLVVKTAYEAALGAGKTEDEAKDAAHAAVEEKRYEQVLRSVGVTD